MLRYAPTSVAFSPDGTNWTTIDGVYRVDVNYELASNVETSTGHTIALNHRLRYVVHSHNETAPWISTLRSYQDAARTDIRLRITHEAPSGQRNETISNCAVNITVVPSTPDDLAHVEITFIATSPQGTLVTFS